MQPLSNSKEQMESGFVGKLLEYRYVVNSKALDCENDFTGKDRQMAVGCALFQNTLHGP